jgi:acyl carrier protein
MNASTSSGGTPTNGSGQDGIVHFDATLRRKEKMKKMAGGEQPATAPAAPVVAKPVASAPQVAAPAPRPVAAPPRVAPAPHIAPAPAAVPAPVTVPIGMNGGHGVNGAVRPAVAPVAKAAAPAPKPAQPAASPAAKVGSSLSGQALEKFLINFVVEQTGYPEEMVEIDADLEADLGIDSIKKAQLFGELSEHFDVQVTEELSLDDFPTLRHVVKFLDGAPQKSAASAAPVAPAAQPQPVAAPVAKAPPAPVAPAPVRPAPVAAVVVGVQKTPASPAPAPAASPAANVTGQLSGKALEEFLINFVVEQTGYPTEMVELDADLEADLGIDSIKKAQLFGELSEYFEVQVTEELSLDDFPTLRHVLKFLDGVPQKGNLGGATTAAKASPAPAAPAAVAPAGPVVPKAPVVPVAAVAPAARRPAVAAPVQPFAASAPPKPAVAPPKAAAAPAPAAPADGDLESFLVNFVVEQTGYPTEMVELDADLEADLGIDSIKKAQLFGELSEYFEVQVTEELSLDDFPTLRHVMNFLQGVPRKSKA